MENEIEQNSDQDQATAIRTDEHLAGVSCGVSAQLQEACSADRMTRAEYDRYYHLGLRSREDSSVKRDQVPKKFLPAFDDGVEKNYLVDKTCGPLVSRYP